MSVLWKVVWPFWYHPRYVPSPVTIPSQYPNDTRNDDIILYVHCNICALHLVVTMQLFKHFVTGHHGLSSAISNFTTQMQMYAHSPGCAMNPCGDQQKHVKFYLWSPWPLQCPCDASYHKI